MQSGGPMVGKVYTQLQSVEDTHNFLLSDKGHRAYPAYDMDEADARLEVRDMPDGPARLVPRSFWRFGRIEDDGTYVPDPDYICAEGKFEKGRLYQIVYTTVGAPVLGLSFAGLRDCVSWFKYGSPDSESPIDISYAYAYGRSQTGRYLRTYIYNDFNRDEQGREALDGIIANVAGGMRGEFNQRFGQNSKDRNNMLTQLVPVLKRRADRSRDRSDGLASSQAGRAQQPASSLLHQHVGRVPQGRRIAHPHGPGRHGGRRPRPERPRVPLHRHRARHRHMAANGHFRLWRGHKPYPEPAERDRLHAVA